jgi:hypothetical protein
LSPRSTAIRDAFVAQPVLGGPLFADELRTSVIALVSPRYPTRALVIRDTVFGSVDSTIAPTVRYLASDPTHFALSWGQQVVAYRWTAVVVFGVFGVALGGVFLALPRNALGELRLEGECSMGRLRWSWPSSVRSKTRRRCDIRSKGRVHGVR